MNSPEQMTITGGLVLLAAVVLMLTDRPPIYGVAALVGMALMLGAAVWEALKK